MSQMWGSEEIETTINEPIMTLETPPTTATPSSPWSWIPRWNTVVTMASTTSPVVADVQPAEEILGRHTLLAIMTLLSIVILGLVIVAFRSIPGGHNKHKNQQDKKNKHITKRLKRIQCALRPIAGVVGFVWTGDNLPPLSFIGPAGGSSPGIISRFPNQYQVSCDMRASENGIRLTAGGNYYVDGFFIGFKESSDINAVAAIVLNCRAFNANRAFYQTTPFPILTAGQVVIHRLSGLILCVPECGGTLSIVLAANENPEPEPMYLVAWELQAFRIPAYPEIPKCCPTYISCPPLSSVCSTCPVATSSSTTNSDETSQLSSDGITVDDIKPYMLYGPPPTV